MLNKVAPTEFENVVEKFNSDDVEYWKGRAETYFKEYVESRLNKQPEEEISSESSESDDIPF